MTEKNEKKKQWSNDSFNFNFSQPPGIGGLVRIGSVLEANALKYVNFVRQQEGNCWKDERFLCKSKYEKKKGKEEKEQKRKKSSSISKYVLHKCEVGLKETGCNKMTLLD